jgi:hypothetical protein
VPHDPASLGIQGICVQSLQSRSQRTRQSLAVQVAFPAPALPDEGALFPIPKGAACMMWQWETKDPSPSESRKGFCGLAGAPSTFTAQSS